MKNEEEDREENMMDLAHINETIQKYMTGELERVPDLSMAEFTPIEAAVAK
jgi:hypothetical protein